MDGVRHSEWISMTSGDSNFLSTDNIVSWDDSVALLALANGLLMLGSWSSYIKSLGGTIVRQEPSLANSSVTTFFPHKMCMYRGSLKLVSILQSS
jgi:hypothetical protein